jgi:hypothetical protein
MAANCLLIDTDAFILLAGSGLLRPAIECLGFDAESSRRLPALPHMLAKSGGLRRKYSSDVRTRANVACGEIPPLNVAPEPETLQRLVDAADLDDGEEVIFGLLFDNPEWIALTGDKRAIEALLQDPGLRDVVQALAGRIACLETILHALLDTLGLDVVAQRLQAVSASHGTLRHVFTAVNIALPGECAKGLVSFSSGIDGLGGTAFLLRP